MHFEIDPETLTEQIDQDVHAALTEDLGPGDATASLVPYETRATARLRCRETAVIAGAAWFDACFRRLDPDVEIDWAVQDGGQVEADSLICTLRGDARALLTAERSALNFLQLMSGTATRTADYASLVAGTKTRLLDTRKTMPGLRIAQKYAVACGGGVNHRFGLYDAILIKENHILAAGGIAAAVKKARQQHPALPLEVEVENLDELEQAIAAGVDRIMLDNFELEQIRAAVAQTAGRVPLEVSGNAEREHLQAIAETGVDFISIGALTKHVRAIDFSLRLDPLPA